MNVQVVKALISIGVAIVALDLVALTVLFFVGGQLERAIMFGFITIVFGFSLATVKLTKT